MGFVLIAAPAMQCSGFEMKVTGTDDLAFRTY